MVLYAGVEGFLENARAVYSSENTLLCLKARGLSTPEASNIETTEISMDTIHP